MSSSWLTPSLAEEIIKNNDIFKETHSIISDIMSGRLDVVQLVENMGGALTNKEPENREKGMRFFTKILKELPHDFLTETQINFISKFYVDRLKDNHRVIPAVLEGYLAIVNMAHYNINNSGEFFTVLFREVPCQSQVRQDRYNIYCITQNLMDKNLEYIKSLGPDFVYGVISAMDGERDPRNLLFLFSFLFTFLKEVPLGHLVDEMFEVISCYYPIDFHPAPDDPAPVTRQDLANALCPCLCAVPEFGEHCLVLLIEKLDSSLRLAKIDSLKLLNESCKTFKVETYGPFLKTLWASIHREITHKTDEELKMVAHETLSALTSKLATASNTDQGFENFLKGILISMQTAIAESTTVAQFVQATKVLLTTANASKESCVIVNKSMIPAIVAYYGFKTTPKLQIASLDFLADLYGLAVHWEVLDQVESEVNEIPRLCLTAVSQPSKEYQIAGFKTLIRVRNALQSDLVLPFVEVLIHNIQHSQDKDLLSVSVETVHAIARKYPENIMCLVIKGKCDLENLTQDKVALEKRLNLLSNLASIDDFTKIIIEEMLKVIVTKDTEAFKVVEAMNESMSNASLYSNEKLSEIESDHGLIDSILSWVTSELHTGSQEALSHGFMLIANTVSSLPEEKQQKILSKHTENILEKFKSDEANFHLVHCLYSSVRQGVYNSTFEDIMTMALTKSLDSNDDIIRTKACVIVAHFLNKAEYGQKFELLYELLKNFLSKGNREQALSSRLIVLYGWITKALIMRGNELFTFWLQKIMTTLSSPEFSQHGCEAIQLIMTDYPDSLNRKQHCRSGLLYKQRFYQNFKSLTSTVGPVDDETKQCYLLSWAYVLEKVPKTVLNSDVGQIAPLIVESLNYDNKDLLQVMLDILCHFVQDKHDVVALSLQTILPRLVNLSKYVKSMDVRIKSLQCLYEIANSYRTMILLPHKQDILLDLAPSLDDKKRLVRNMAVKARTRWFLVGSPGENKEKEN
ncbi:MMS19 nucleotide excision repair protein homolog [Ostrinia furnacalis]|uniref:MMS19 nucleotide excision repair protein homolog n=1 Tax=Ostrinia furnacalis TaxID=93504 RepID=UPI00103BB19A|nr:MMS19 nucleotide excision repair protein homolog [Ostrinia furnacalis]